MEIRKKARNKSCKLLKNNDSSFHHFFSILQWKEDMVFRREMSTLFQVFK